MCHSPLPPSSPHQRHLACHSRRGDLKSQSETTNVRTLGASWQNFIDPDSGVATYFVQFLLKQGDVVLNMTSKIDVGLTNK
jgi:hypothetical protein